MNPIYKSALDEKPTMRVPAKTRKKQQPPKVAKVATNTTCTSIVCVLWILYSLQLESELFSHSTQQVIPQTPRCLKTAGGGLSHSRLAMQERQKTYVLNQKRRIVDMDAE